MNYYEEFKSTPSNRTPYFQYVLNLFNEKPINILELGTSRELVNWLGDGRSSFHFIEYIDKFGGNFITNDLEQQNIDNCRELLKTYPNINDLKDRVKYVVGDALELLEENKKTNWADLVYLDVGDSPQLTLDCFEKIDLDKTVIFCDDFSSKGVLLSQKYPNYLEMGWPQPIGHKMALYKKNQIKAWIFVRPIEK